MAKRKFSNPFTTPGSSKTTMVRRKSSSSSAGSRMMLDSVAGTIANTPTGNPYIRAAQAAYKVGVVGKRIYDAYKGSTPKRTKPGTKKWAGVSTGRYKGNFRKPKKVKKTMLNQSLQKGFAETSEFFGRVEDPECVYIGHSTRDCQAYANTISAMFIRDLFKKAGYKIANRLEELNLAAWDNSSGFKLQFVIQNVSNTGTALGPVVSDFEITDNLTLTQVAQQFSGFNAWVYDYITTNSTAVQGQIPFKMILYSKDKYSNGDSFEWRMASQIDLAHQFITFHAKSTLVIQNRTSAAGAETGNKNLDRVDNQPLAGKMYEFSQATPRLGQAHTSFWQLNSIPYRGNVLIRSAEMDSSLQNSPDPKIWTNCTKVSNVLIQPGEMKQSVITHTFEGRLLTVLKRMRVANNFNGSTNGGAGKFHMIQLEEKLRTTSANPVTVQYERKIELMCFSKPTKSPGLLQTLAVVELNNLP